MSINNKAKRPFIGIIFDCCNVYQRIYINKDKTAFVGFCPKCAKKVEIRISKTGVDDRFFRVG